MAAKHIRFLEASKYSIVPTSAILLRILDTSTVIGNVSHVLLAPAGAAFTTAVLILCKAWSLRFERIW